MPIINQVKSAIMSAVDLAVKNQPGKNGLQISFGCQTDKELDVVLLNIDGRKIFEFEVNTVNKSFDLLNLPQSIYILQVYDKQGNMQTYKLIKS